MIPDDVNIQAWLKPDGSHLQMLMRVPFTAINDIQFPLRDGDYLDLSKIDTVLPGASKYWIADAIQVYENGAPLPKPEIAETRVSLPSDKSFGSWDSALAHLEAPKPARDTDIIPSQAYLDVLFEYPIQSDRSDFSIRTSLVNLAARVWMDLKFVPPESPLGSPVRAFSWEGDPGLVRLNPGVSDAARQSIAWGFQYIFTGTDYLLFLFCLMLPFRSAREVISLTCVFAAAHIVTLIASALGQAPDELWFRPLIETLMAVIILYAALENIAGIGRDGREGVTLWRRTVMAAISGLVFGFSFGFGLAAKAQYGSTHPAIAAISYTAGIEAGLILIVAAMMPLVNLLVRITPAKRVESIVLSALAAHVAWHWMSDRWDRLNRFPFRWPAIDAAFLATAMQWTMILLIIAGALWLLSGLFQPKPDKTSPGPIA